MAAVDFHQVYDHHKAIDQRLCDWARWVTVHPQEWGTQPMFRQYRSKAFQWETPEFKMPVNTLIAHETEKAVALMPEKHRVAIRWCYVFRNNPTGCARSLGLTLPGLLCHIHEGRTIISNRFAKSEFM